MLRLGEDEEVTLVVPGGALVAALGAIHAFLDAHAGGECPNKDWQSYLAKRDLPNRLQAKRIKKYLKKYAAVDVIPDQSPEYERLLKIKDEIMLLMEEADQLAKIIRDKSVSGFLALKQARARGIRKK